MSPAQPLISVSLVTYNHEHYVGAAIESVIRQSFTDWELIIVNDGSTDKTRERIRAYNDRRIVCIDQENQGPAAAANAAIAKARGKYLALLSGDDLCHVDRLERQLQAYTAGPRRVLFGEVDLIGDGGQPLERPNFASNLFDSEPLTRGQILERFFHHGNFFNSVTLFAERDLFLEAGPYDPSLFQLHDFEMWLRMVKKYDLHVVPEPVVHYRIHEHNLSRPDPERTLRMLNERYLIGRGFFDGVSPELFRDAFKSALIYSECRTEIECKCEQAFLFLKSSFGPYQLIGMEKLHELLNQPGAASVLKRRYNFSPGRLANALKSADATGFLRGPSSTVCLDSGAGFREENVISKMTNTVARDFYLVFEIPKPENVQAARWVPMKDSWCKVRLTNVWFRDAGFRMRRVDPISVKSNGRPLADGFVAFETLEPAFIIPIDDEIYTLIVEGEWEQTTISAAIAEHDRRFQRAIAKQNAKLQSGRFQAQNLLEQQQHAAQQTLQRFLARREEELRQERDAAKAEVREDAQRALIGVVQKHQDECDRLRTQATRDTRMVVNHYEEQLVKMEKDIRSLVQSRSWRWTAPLRTILSRFRSHHGTNA